MVTVRCVAYHRVDRSGLSGPLGMAASTCSEGTSGYARDLKSLGRKAVLRFVDHALLTLELHLGLVVVHSTAIAIVVMIRIRHGADGADDRLGSFVRAVIAAVVPYHRQLFPE